MVTSFPTPQGFVYSNFKGIRTRNGINTGGTMSATVCQNIDFIPNTVGTDIQIRSTLGNKLVAQYPDFSLIKGFETVQDGIKHHLVYAETNGYSKEEFDLSKFTVVGSPTITEDGVASGFSSSSYLTFNISLNCSNYTIEGQTVVPESLGVESAILLLGDSRVIIGASGNLVLYNDTLYSIITYPMIGLEGHSIKFKFDINGSGSTLTIIDLTENKTYITTSTKTVALTNVTEVLVGQNGKNYCRSSIDLSQFSITVDGEEVFKGTKTVEYPEKGILLEYIAFEDRFEVIQDDLLVTGQANGITMNDTAYDVFVFTNGKDYYSINFAITPITQVINPVYEGQQLTGLSLCEKDGALVIGSEEFAIVMGSRQGDIYDWDYVTTSDQKTKPWFYPFGKGVTAVVPYIGGLLVFTADDSTMLKGNPADLATFEKLDASIGGCMSFESWCYHDKYLFFYDDTQKNIYYYTQIDTGQKILGEPIAPEVQKYFDDVKRLQFTGYVGENRNEIWILSDKFKLIYDYFIGEWSERVCQDISSYYVYDNAVYSTTPDGKILKEKESLDSCKFEEAFYPAVYTMQTINLGSYSNMKEMEMQPLFTVSDNNDNEFWVDCLIDGKKTKSKKVQMIVNGGVWGDDSDEIFPECQFDVSIFSSGSDHITHQLKGKFVSNWYYLQFTVRTEELGQEFNIMAMELKGITVETDTIGRK